jgi:hypothetical protein
MTVHLQTSETQSSILQAEIEGRIRNNALGSIVTAAGLGFLLGGGLRSGPGRNLLIYAGRAAIRELFLARLLGGGGLSILLSGRSFNDIAWSKILSDLPNADAGGQSRHRC